MNVLVEYMSTVFNKAEVLQSLLYYALQQGWISSREVEHVLTTHQNMLEMEADELYPVELYVDEGFYP